MGDLLGDAAPRNLYRARPVIVRAVEVGGASMFAEMRRIGAAIGIDEFVLPPYGLQWSGRPRPGPGDFVVRMPLDDDLGLPVFLPSLLLLSPANFHMMFIPARSVEVPTS